MTAKRFEICDVDLYEYGMPLNEIIDNGVPLSQKQVCELLNELNDENEQLKKEKESLIKGIKDSAKQGADSIIAVWESKNRPTTMSEGYYD